MTNAKNTISTLVVATTTGAIFAYTAPFVSADSAWASAVVFSRSFPKASLVEKSLLAESTSIPVDGNSKWGSIETLDVPQTGSQAEKKAVVAATAQKAADETAVVQSAAVAASRSEQRVSIPQADLSKMTGTGAELTDFSLKFQGYPYIIGGNTPARWNCSGFVRYIFSQFGIPLPRTSGTQTTVDTPVASLTDAEPGNILANGTHVAIYIGSGQVMNAMNPAQGTIVSGVSVFDGAGYPIHRTM